MDEGMHYHEALRRGPRKDKLSSEAEEALHRRDMTRDPLTRSPRQRIPMTLSDTYPASALVAIRLRLQSCSSQTIGCSIAAPPCAARTSHASSSSCLAWIRTGSQHRAERCVSRTRTSRPAAARSLIVSDCPTAPPAQRLCSPILSLALLSYNLHVPLSPSPPASAANPVRLGRPQVRASPFSTPSWPLPYPHTA